METYLSNAIQTLEARSRRATVAAWIFFVIQLSSAPLVIAIALGMVTPTSAISLFDTFMFLSLVLSIIFVGMWIHRAHANLFAAGLSELEYSPGWSVGWFFVPFLNLFKPYDAMRELWHATLRDTVDRFDAPGPTELKTWWGLWLAGNIASNVSQRLQASADADVLLVGTVIAAAGSLALAGAAYCLIRIMREITNGQSHGLSISEVFA